MAACFPASFSAHHIECVPSIISDCLKRNARVTVGVGLTLLWLHRFGKLVTSVSLVMSKSKRERVPVGACN